MGCRLTIKIDENRDPGHVESELVDYAYFFALHFPSNQRISPCYRNMTVELIYHKGRIWLADDTSVALEGNDHSYAIRRLIKSDML